MERLLVENTKERLQTEKFKKFTGLGDELGLAPLEALPRPVPEPLGLPLLRPVPRAWGLT